ncbi:hypothetical protein BOMU111920_23435 [Bordetella muralis]
MMHGSQCGSFVVIKRKPSTWHYDEGLADGSRPRFCVHLEM